MTRRHTIVSRRDLDRPAYQRLVGARYEDGTVIAVEVQRDQWVALVEDDAGRVRFVPCAVVARGTQ
jgi:hypothetical protein